MIASVAALTKLLRAHINQTRDSYVDVLERGDYLGEEKAAVRR